MNLMYRLWKDDDGRALIFMGAGAVAFTAVLVLILIAAARQEAAFMQECMTERKQYECTTMWRQANPPAQTVVVRQ